MTGTRVNGQLGATLGVASTLVAGALALIVSFNVPAVSNSWRVLPMMIFARSQPELIQSEAKKNTAGSYVSRASAAGSGSGTRLVSVARSQRLPEANHEVGKPPHSSRDADGQLGGDSRSRTLGDKGDEATTARARSTESAGGHDQASRQARTSSDSPDSHRGAHRTDGGSHATRHGDGDGRAVRHGSSRGD